MRVLADQDAPAIGLDPVEDDRRRLRRRRRRLLAGSAARVRATISWMSASTGCGDVEAHRGDARARLRDLPARSARRQSLPLCTLRELATIEVPMWPGMTTEHLMCGALSLQIGDQRLGEALHRELRRAVGGVRHARPERRPEAVDAAGVDDVRLRRPSAASAGTRACRVDAAPADVERPLPLLAAVGDHAAAAADAGVVEQQVDPVGAVLRRRPRRGSAAPAPRRRRRRDAR